MFDFLINITIDIHRKYKLKEGITLKFGNKINYE